MSKIRPKPVAARTPEPATSKAPARPVETKDHGDGMRETIESVVVAFVLAFLFRTFEAEAFVIPTGSMAPTLMGRHKDLTCEKCGYPYRVSASDEVNRDGYRIVESDHMGRPLPNGRPISVDSSTCPMCRYTMDLGGARKEEQYPSYRGDRILVAKFPYELEEPERWDVVVFKYPQEAATNYIKRLVGLPHEEVWIVHGDIYTRSEESEDFAIARKDPVKLQAMLQTVYDNDYVLPSMIQKGWPARWQAWTTPLPDLLARNWRPQPMVTSPGELPPGHWQTSDDYRSFSTNGSSTEEVWLRYQHTVPSPRSWEQLEDGNPVRPEATLIEDFNAYNHFTVNTHGMPMPTPPDHSSGAPWVGDLVVDFEAQIGGNQGTLTVELVEGGVSFQCQIDVASGEATLHSSLGSLQARAVTKVKGPGTYRLAFANVDDEITLWVDGKVVQFEGQTTYDSHTLGNTVPREADYAPVGIASQGVPVKIDHLCLLRDLYYIAVNSPYAGGDNPDGVKFPLEADQFFVLGDNSARSADSRMWMHGERYVHRDMMIGKALYVYWPHSWDKIPGTDIPFPFFPNFARMGFVR
jgi:signal peptidase I